MGRRVVVLSPAVLVAAAAMVVVWGAGVARGDFASDQADCVAALQVGLSACLTYVEGRANSPPPDCCTGLRRVMGERPKCLCVLVRDGDDPHLGFKINAARAMSLPGVCSVPANTSYCPRTGLLKLDPNSKDADVFKQLASSSEQGNALSSYDDERVTFVIGNMCPFPIWPAAAPNTGHPVIAAGGFFLPSGAARRVKAPPSWNGRLWARTGCDFDSAAKPGCQTGDCQGRLACNGSVGLPPATLVEVWLQGGAGKPSYYDISLLDGYNLPVTVEARPSQPGCSIAGCATSPNRDCPPDLRVVAGEGRRREAVACKSACLAYGRDELCCRNGHGTPETCRPSSSSRAFKDACPSYRTHAFDAPAFLRSCVSKEYVVTFCPPSRRQWRSI